MTGERLCAHRGVQVVHRDVARPTSGALAHEVLDARERLRRRPHLLQRRHPTLAQLEDRLHRERLADERGGGADAAAATQIVERVDVEERVRRRRSRQHDVGDGVRVGSGLGRARSIEHREPHRHRDAARVDDDHRDGRVLRRQARCVDGARHVAGQVRRDDRGRTCVDGRGVGLREALRRRARGGDHRPLAQRLGDLVRSDLRALVVGLPADDHLDRHDPDPVRGDQISREVGGGVGDKSNAVSHPRTLPTPSSH